MERLVVSLRVDVLIVFFFLCLVLRVGTLHTKTCIHSAIKPIGTGRWSTRSLLYRFLLLLAVVGDELSTQALLLWLLESS